MPPPPEPGQPQEAEPTLGQKEVERRAAWLEVPANVRREIERFRVNMCHRSSTGVV